MSRSARDESGSGVVEFVWLTILLLVPFVYILLAVFDTQRASYAVSTASRSAARAFLQAPDEQIGRQRAQQAADLALDDQRVDARVAIRCLPSPSACLQPGSSVRVVVSTTQPLPLTPSALGDDVGGISVDSEHTEPFGSFREAR